MVNGLGTFTTVNDRAHLDTSSMGDKLICNLMKMVDTRVSCSDRTYPSQQWASRCQQPYHCSKKTFCTWVFAHNELMTWRTGIIGLGSPVLVHDYPRLPPIKRRSKQVGLISCLRYLANHLHTLQTWPINFSSPFLQNSLHYILSEKPWSPCQSTFIGSYFR